MPRASRGRSIGARRGLEAAIWAACSLFLLACSDPALNTGLVAVEIAPTEVRFDGVYVGTTEQQSVRLIATGARGTRYSLRFDGPAEAFLAGPAEGSVRLAEPVDIWLGFRPERPGPHSGTLLIDLEGASPLRVALFGRALPVPDCEDGNGCTDDHFDLSAGRCVRSERSGAACNDLNACTALDACAGALCLGTGRDCDDSNACTDDFCDPQMGCVHAPTARCDDDNECTRDFCLEDESCRHENEPTGTPCGAGVQCQSSQGCWNGRCRTVSQPDGSACDDGDPCSKNERCEAGRCEDPGYRRAAAGEIKFSLDLGPLAPGSERGPLVTGGQVALVGVQGGVVAVTPCGEEKWRNSTIGTPNWDRALSAPGVLWAPVGAEIVEVSTATGGVTQRIDLAAAARRIWDVATATVAITDLGLRPSGLIVATTSIAIEQATYGALWEVDPGPPAAATVLQHFDPGHVPTDLALDADGAAIIALTAPGELGGRRIARIAVDSAESWSTNTSTRFGGGLSLGADGAVYAGASSSAFTRAGALRHLASGSGEAPSVPRLGAGWAWRLSGCPEEPDQACALRWAEDAPTDDVRSVSLGVPLSQVGPPAIDQRGASHWLLSPRTLLALDTAGETLWRTELPEGASASAPEPTITTDGLILIVHGTRLTGVQSVAPLAARPWPRGRRDNFGSNHL